MYEFDISSRDFSISRLFLLFLDELAWSIDCEIRIRKETEIGLETFGLEKNFSIGLDENSSLFTEWLFARTVVWLNI